MGLVTYYSRAQELAATQGIDLGLPTCALANVLLPLTCPKIEKLVARDPQGHQVDLLKIGDGGRSIFLFSEPDPTIAPGSTCFRVPLVWNGLALSSLPQDTGSDRLRFSVQDFDNLGVPHGYSSVELVVETKMQCDKAAITLLHSGLVTWYLNKMGV